MENDLESKSYDLTTKEGYKNAFKYYKKNRLYFAGGLPGIAILAIKDVFFSADKKTNQQIKIAENLIKHGKEQGVDSMTVKVNNKTGAHLKSTMKEFPLEFTLGSNNDIEVTVKYK